MVTDNLVLESEGTTPHGFLKLGFTEESIRKTVRIVMEEIEKKKRARKVIADQEKKHQIRERYALLREREAIVHKIGIREIELITEMPDRCPRFRIQKQLFTRKAKRTYTKTICKGHTHCTLVIQNKCKLNKVLPDAQMSKYKDQIREIDKQLAFLKD